MITHQALGINIMATAAQLKALVKAHFDGQNDLFNSCVLQIAAHEAKQGHGALAVALKKILDSGRNRVFYEKISVPQELNGLVMTEESNVSKASLVIPEELAERLNRIIHEYRQKSKLKSHGLTNRRKILLTGPSGTGKTMTAKMLAHELSLPLNTIQVDRLVTKFMGETSSKLRQIFEFMATFSGVYLFDEFDAIGGDRALENDVGEMRRILNSFLQFIEQDKSESIILAATNNPKLLDNALFRRFDDILYYSHPDKNSRAQLINNVLNGFSPLNCDWDKLLDYSNNLSHAEITAACLDAIKQTILNDSKRVAFQELLQAISYRKINHTDDRAE